MTPSSCIRSGIRSSSPARSSASRCSRTTGATEPFPTVIGRHFPEVYEPKREAQRAAVLWTVWNERAEAHADFTYRLEDMDAGLVMRLAELLELDVSEQQVGQALEDTPGDVNRRLRNEKVPWELIAPVAKDLAAHYGYEAPVHG